MNEVTKQFWIQTLGREFVIQVKGTVIEREKTKNIPTGEIEILVTELTILNATPLFHYEDETDGGEDIRMKYRYLDIRESSKNSLLFRHKVAMEVQVPSDLDLRSETPYLIKSTPKEQEILLFLLEWMKGNFINHCISTNLQTTHRWNGQISKS
jgi:aspartyl-tRNA synthetase